MYFDKGFNMKDISKLSNVESTNVKPIKLKQLKKSDDVSIFTKFDTNNSETISDNEIRKQGYVGKAFNKVKQYLINRFGQEKIANPTDENGYFQYSNWQPEQRVIKSLDELELRNGCCYDVRGCDITQLDLSEEQLLNLTIDKTTVMTPEQKAIIEPYMEAAKNPGLGIRQLHEQGLTGKGVNMAIIDQPLGMHQEYADNIIGQVHDINSEKMGWLHASMHGAAVTSIAVGKNVGVAPDAGVVYYSAVNLTKKPEDIKEYRVKIQQEMKTYKDSPHYMEYLQMQLSNIDRMGACSSNKPYVEAINKILDENEKLPEEERVSVISISWGFDELAPGYEELQKALQRAKDQGVFIVSTALDRDYNMDTCGANRNPKGDLDNSDNYEAGAFWKQAAEETPMDKEYNDKFLLVPMDHRTVADFTDGTSYRYEGNDGGMSWSTPWLAGMYVLAKQAAPDITPEKFWEYALETSDECKNNDTGQYVGRIINPQALIKKIQE